MDHLKSLYWICYNIASALWFGFLAARLPEIKPTTPALRRKSLHSWTAREVAVFTFLSNGKTSKAEYFWHVKHTGNSQFGVCEASEDSHTRLHIPTLATPWTVQARILEWVAISSSRGSSWRLIVYHWAIREAQAMAPCAQWQSRAAVRESVRSAQWSASPPWPFAEEACSRGHIPRDQVCDVLSFTVPELGICLARSRYSVNSGWTYEGMTTWMRGSWTNLCSSILQFSHSVTLKHAGVHWLLKGFSCMQTFYV